MVCGCSFIKEARYVNSLAPKYEERWIVVASKPKMQLFQDVDLYCQGAATIFMAENASVVKAQQDKQRRSDEAVGDQFAGVREALNKPHYDREDASVRSGFYNQGYTACMNMNGWDLRFVCNVNCSKADRALWDKAKKARKK